MKEVVEMKLLEYLVDKKITNTTLNLIEMLKIYSENDDEFIIGILNDLETDYERNLVLEYIKKNINVSYESILLFSLEIEQNRNT